MKQKQMTLAIVSLLLVGLVVFGLVSCHNSNKKWQLAKADFEQKATQTIRYYGPSIKESYVNSASVGIKVDPERWNNSDSSTQRTFLEEVCKLLEADAETSGILEYLDVHITFRNGDEVINQIVIKGK